MNFNRKAVSAIISSSSQDATMSAKSQKGFSLPSVIVGSIIAAILGGMALTSMWGSVDKAAIAAEVGSIAEVKTAAAGLREDSNGYPTLLDATNDANALSRTAQLPKEFKYQLVLMTDGGTPAKQYMALKAVANGAEGRDRLNAIAASLDNRYDGTASGSETPTAGQFVYSTTCSAPTTFATNETDCYYATPVMAKSIMTSDMASDTAADSGTAALSSTLSTDVADYVTELN